MKKLITLLLICGALWWTGSCAYAGEIDLLLQKLVEKGVLTASEAQEVKTETQEQAKLEIAQGKNAVLPSWLQTIKLKGDFRTRFQHEIRKGSNLNGGATASQGSTTERNRGRIRLRVGAEARVVDKVKVHFGLATGSDADPRSTNQTFQDAFAKKSIWLDYAYGEYTPFKWLTASMGRMKNPLWEPGDLLWDRDINPEGLALQFNKNFNPKLQAYMNSGLFLVSENANASDPWMVALQPGLKYAITPEISLNTAVAYYGFKQLEGWVTTANSFSAGSNSKNAKGGYKYNFNSLSPSMQLGINNPFKQIGVKLPWGFELPYLALYGEYHDNMSTGNSHIGYMGGLIAGYEKVADKGQWQVLYNYAMLGTDAWPDFLPDSDRYSGRTGIRSHNIRWVYGLNKNWTAGVNYWRSDLTSATPDIDLATSRVENLFMGEANFKF